MYQDATLRHIPGQTRRPQSRIQRILLKKIWLPRSIYATLPFLYLALGAYALTVALFLSHWSWLMPYLVLIGVGCVQFGTYVLGLRWRGRRRVNQANLRH